MKPHLELAHKTWEQFLRPGDCAIDATCGNGKDTLKLAQLVGPAGTVIGLDIQEVALQKTRQYLQQHLQPEALNQVHLYRQSHETFPEKAFEFPIRLIVYNLGFLPGGDKSLTTQTRTTLSSLQAALSLIAPGGLISLTCYPGHPEGANEAEALKEAVSRLPSPAWTVSTQVWAPRFPFLTMIIKN